MANTTKGNAAPKAAKQVPCMGPVTAPPKGFAGPGKKGANARHCYFNAMAAWVGCSVALFCQWQQAQPPHVPPTKGGKFTGKPEPVSGWLSHAKKTWGLTTPLAVPKAPPKQYTLPPAVVGGPTRLVKVQVPKATVPATSKAAQGKG